MIIQNLFRYLTSCLTSLSMRMVLTICSFHFVSSYCILKLANESSITGDLVTYLYFWVVVSSTTGFGDITPETALGKIIVSIYFIPFSLMVFTIMLAKIGEKITSYLRNIMQGGQSFHQLQDHIIIVGYNRNRTSELVSLIMADKKRDARTILVVTTDQIEHPFLNVDFVEFCRVDSYSKSDSLERIALQSASRVIIDGKNDDENFALAVHMKNKVSASCHISSFMMDEDKANTLRELGRNIEVTTPQISAQLVRTMQDHGTSQTFQQLLTSGIGQTIYVLNAHLPRKLSVSIIEDDLKKDFGAKLMGYSRCPSARDLKLNPPLDELLDGDVYLHYMAENRIKKDIVW